MLKIAKRAFYLRAKELLFYSSLFWHCRGGTGSEVVAFEKEFGMYVGCDDAVAVSSGRSALLLILESMGVEKGEEVILSALNYSGVPAYLSKNGLKPVFVDIDSQTLQMDHEKLENAITPRTKAVVMTHLFGNTGNLEAILDIAKRRGLYVIEDAAHALGTLYKGKHVGQFSDAAFFSFTGSKTLNSSFGGIVVTNNIRLANTVRARVKAFSNPRKIDLILQRLRTYILAFLFNRVVYTFTGYPISVLLSFFDKDILEGYKKRKKKNIAEKRFKFSDFQASILRDQLANIEDRIKSRISSGMELTRLLLSSETVLQKGNKFTQPNFYMIPILSNQKKLLYKKLLIAGIDSNQCYVSNCAETYGVKCRQAARVAESILAVQLPFFLSENEVKHVSRILSQN